MTPRPSTILTIERWCRSLAAQLYVHTTARSASATAPTPLIAQIADARSVVSTMLCPSSKDARLDVGRITFPSWSPYPMDTKVTTADGAVGGRAITGLSLCHNDDRLVVTRGSGARQGAAPLPEILRKTKVMLHKGAYLHWYDRYLQRDVGTAVKDMLLEACESLEQTIDDYTACFMP